MMTDQELLERISTLRPWWWRLCPWLYACILEDYLREVVEKLEEERASVVVIPYRCRICGTVG